MKGIQQLLVTFPKEVELPVGFEHVLADLVDMVCKLYEQKNPTRMMWPSGQGALPLMDFFAVDPDKLKPGEKYEPFDDSYFAIQVSEKPADEKTLRKRGFKVLLNECPECGELQFRRDMQDEYECANGHIHDSPGKLFERLHVLHFGRTLCNMPGLPEDWQPGHKWEGLTDFRDRRAHVDEITCEVCKRKYKRDHAA